METEENKNIHSSFWANIFNTPTEETDLKKLLQSIPLFSELGRKDLTLLMNIIHSRSYLPGEYIFYQGDPGIGLYVIREGSVEIYRENENGEKLKLATFNKGDFFGELAMVDGEKRSASAVAAKETKVGVIFKPDLDEFIEKYPKKGIKILYGIAHIIAVRIRNLNEDYFTLQNKLRVEED